MRARLIWSILLCWTTTALAAGIGEEEYAWRRGRVAEMLDSGGVALFRSAEPKMRGPDIEYRYRQESNLLYLTGLNEPNVVLILTGASATVDGRPVRRILLVEAGTLERLRAGGQFADGILVEAGRLQEILSAVTAGKRTLYLSAPDLTFTNDWLNGRPLFIDRDARKEFEKKVPGLKIKGAGVLLATLRGIKSAEEVSLIRRAIDATGSGIRKAMEISRAGRFEYELQGELEGEMLKQGAAYVGFPSIVGSGPNSLILHYSENRREMRDGEMVVMDVGAEMEGYSADITRSFPVNGRFSDAQRKVYSAVLQAQKAAISAVRPGETFAGLERAARTSLNASGFGKYLTHGISHHLGLDTHDAGPLDTLRTGMVVTIEPGAYIPEADTLLAPEFKGWGVRIEDDVLVTRDGAVVLSSGIPKEVDEIEGIMKK
jgi:Xaa-Pro aminopeptidase